MAGFQTWGEVGFSTKKRPQWKLSYRELANTTKPAGRWWSGGWGEASPETPEYQIHRSKINSNLTGDGRVECTNELTDLISRWQTSHLILYIKFYWNTALLICLPIAHGCSCFRKAELSDRDPYGPARPKMCIIWPFTENLCQPLVQKMSGLHLRPTEIRICGTRSRYAYS